MNRPIVLVGCWPRRMTADLAATYCGEPTASAFLERVGSKYPQPWVSEGGPSDSNEVTVERLESAIKVTARCMVEHDLPQLLPTLKRLEAERDRLVQEGDAIEYARRLLVVLAET
jgi:hypothetical protein